MIEFWSFCLRQFEKELSQQQFNTWIRPLRIEPDPGSARTLRLVAPNRFVHQWVRERYLSRIEELGRTYVGGPIAITLSTMETPVAAGALERTPDLASSSGRQGVGSAQKANAAPSDGGYQKTGLNPALTFDTLISGRANDLARVAAIRVAQNPGTTHNPLIIWGGVGLGKTHLIHALGNALFQRNPALTIRYRHAEDYYADFIRAYRQESVDVFRRCYRSLDVLLIDDIQFFSDKNRTRAEFFHTVDALDGEARNTQIVVTCDTDPQALIGREDRLGARFDAGLTVAIQPPKWDLRVAILKKKAAAEAIDLGEDIAILIAKHFSANVRELEGALKRVLAFARFFRRNIDLELAKEALQDLLGAANRQMTLEAVQKTVADYYKSKLAEMDRRRIRR